MNKNQWIDKMLLKVFEAEGTDAYRLCTIDDGWAERFGPDILILHKTKMARERLLLQLVFWRTSVGFELGRVFARDLPKKNEERATPKLVEGEAGESLKAIAREQGLKYAIDFAAGYSVGFFVDQRENRRFVRQTRPKRLLNCFAYTCSFSVAAASIGAQTVSIDLSKKSLGRGKENFVLNNLGTDTHRFVADDVMTVLPRLARKGEKFDMIILDPPTFSRSHGGKVFHVERDYETLLATALEVASPNACVLLSTNYSHLHEKALEAMARYCLKQKKRAAEFHRQPHPVDFPSGVGASTIWLSLH
jgi:23S rRNA (cytosine1962-C5)-methyltransferase